MNLEVKKLSDCKKELVITVTETEYKEAFNNKLNDVKKNIKMPGFRPGKVPNNLILSKYGASVKYETQEDLANKQLKTFFEENEHIRPLGTPALTNIKENDDKSQSYVVEFEIFPEFELNDYKSLEVYEPYHKVTDEEIDKELEFISRKFGTKSEIDIFSKDEAKNIVLTVDSYEIDNETRQVIDKEPYKDITLDLSLPEMDKLIEVLANHKVNDEIEHFPENMSDVVKPEKIIIKKIEKNTPAEQNDDFAKLASGNRFDNFDDYKQEIGFALQKEWDSRTKELMENQIINKLVEQNNQFELPQVLINGAYKQISDSYKKQYPAADMENERIVNFNKKYAETLVRAEIIRDKIIEAEEIKIEDYDYDNYIDNFYTEHPEYRDVFPEDKMMSMLHNDERMNNTLLQKKYMDLLLDFTKTNEIDYHEYIKLNDTSEQEHNETINDSEIIDNV